MVDAVLTVNRSFERPDAELLAAFRDVPTGHLCDAQNRMGGLDYRIKPVTRVRSFVGTAITVHAGPRDNLAPYAALPLVQAGDALLITTDDHISCSVIGDIYTGMAKNCGAVGIVTDGLVRDVAGLDQVGIPVYAAGVSPNSPWKNGPGMVGLSVVVGGVSVHSGDIVVADAEGVVVIPLARAWAVRDALEAVQRKEAAMEQAVTSGQKWPEWLEQTLEQKGVNYLE